MDNINEIIETQNRIRNIIINASEIIGESAFNKYWNDYKTFNEYSLAPVALKNSFGKIVKTFLSEIKNRFNKPIEKTYKQIFDEISAFLEDCSKCDKNSMWRLAALVELYHNTDELSKNAVNDFSEAMIQQADETINDIFGLFGEIYSDIFAFYMMRFDKCDPDDKKNVYSRYVRTLVETVGAYKHKWLNKECHCIRLIVLWDAMIEPKHIEKDNLNYSDFSGKIKGIFNYSADDDFKMVEQIINRFKNSTLYYFIGEYIKLCKEQIEKMRTDHMDDVTLKLNELYFSTIKEKMDIDKAVELIHYFWSVSTNRE